MERAFQYKVVKFGGNSSYVEITELQYQAIVDFCNAVGNSFIETVIHSPTSENYSLMITHENLPGMLVTNFGVTCLEPTKILSENL